MLEEIEDLKPESGGEKRRWFRDEYFDLFVWSDAQGIRAFELCYDKLGNERVLAWRRGGDVSHAKVDPGEDNPSKNNTPILVPGKGNFYRKDVLGRFTQAGALMDAGVFRFVADKLGQSP